MQRGCDYMKRKIKNYLNSKNKNEYNELDRVFEMYVNGEKIVVMFFDGNIIVPSQITSYKEITTTNSDGKLVTVVEMMIEGNKDEYELKVGFGGVCFKWLGFMWDSNVGLVNENGITFGN